MPPRQRSSAKGTGVHSGGLASTTVVAPNTASRQRSSEEKREEEKRKGNSISKNMRGVARLETVQGVVVLCLPRKHKTKIDGNTGHTF